MFLKISQYSQEVKHLCWSLFLIKLQVWKRSSSLKRDSNTSVFFPMNIVKFSKKTFFTEHLQWLLLNKMLCLVFATHKLRFGRSMAILQKKCIFTVNQIPPPDPTSFEPTRLLEKTILQEMFRQMFTWQNFYIWSPWWRFPNII